MFSSIPHLTIELLTDQAQARNIGRQKHKRPTKTKMIRAGNRSRLLATQLDVHCWQCLHDSNSHGGDMHYPIMNETQVAFRWKISLKTLRRWRSENTGPMFHKCFGRVRYHESDVLEYERQGVKHWKEQFSKGDNVPRFIRKPPIDDERAKSPEEPSASNEDGETRYLTSEELIALTTLPECFFRSPADRDRKRVPHILIGSGVRFSLDAILEWELANSKPGITAVPSPQAPTHVRV